MRKNLAVLGGILIVAFLGVYALGQQGAEQGSTGSFYISGAGDSAVLLETRSGRTWLLHRSADEAQPSAWLPIERMTTDDDAAKWRALEQERANTLGLRRQQAQKLEKLRAQFVNMKDSPQKQRIKMEIADLEAKRDEK